MKNRLLDRRTLDFILFDVLDLEHLMKHDFFSKYDRYDVGAVMDTADEVARDKFRSYYRKSDIEEPKFNTETRRVNLPPETGEAVLAFHEAGFAAVHFDKSLGGLELPWTVSQAAFAHFQAANVGASAYPFLTIAAANLIRAHGTEDQIARYVPAMMTGRYFGTMALSEPQAGSSLANVRTKATPVGDGTYRIKGAKMWTSCGAHDVSENIMHMVLARVEGAPAGVKGLSLFVVPQYRLDMDGGRVGPNGVRLAGLNHKMGYRAAVNTALSFGEDAECIGDLIGEENSGLSQMFHMMNEARIGVGASAVMLAYAGYMESVAYAEERRQGRKIGAGSGDNPAGALLIEHPDIRRMLLLQKSVAEAGLTLVLYCAELVDRKNLAKLDGDKETGWAATLLLDILTPVLKAWFSDAALRANDAAIQIHGGYGYTRDFLVEQIYRDNRLNPIHEGTNGIQALDLMGRKLWSEDGAAFEFLIGEMRADCEGMPDELTEMGEEYLEVLSEYVDTVMFVKRRGEKGSAGHVDLANSEAFMDATGRLVLGWMTLRLARAAVPLEKDAFRAGKIAAAKYVMAWEVPKARPMLVLLRNGDDTLLATDPDCFFLD